MGIFPPPFLRYNKLKQTVENWSAEEIISEKKVGEKNRLLGCFTGQVRLEGGRKDCGGIC